MVTVQRRLRGLLPTHNTTTSIFCDIFEEFLEALFFLISGFRGFPSIFWTISVDFRSISVDFSIISFLDVLRLDFLFFFDGF